MKIAIVGAGIAGLSAAYYLSKEHEVIVFESSERIGGHTATVDVEHDGKQYAIDTGFIVYNDWTYPHFISLLDELDVETQPTSMSFSVCCENSGIEYAGSNINTLFAQRSNFFNLDFFKMLLDIKQFNREAVQYVEQKKNSETMTLGEYLLERQYSQMFVDQYLVPMGAAIWSSSTDNMFDFPLLFFVRFFKNHGLLSIKNRPQWRVIKGGSRSYLKPLMKSFEKNIITNSKVMNIVRSENEVIIQYQTQAKSETLEKRFDALVLATHSDQALNLLKNVSAIEKTLLSSIPYQSNEVVLHTDEKLLPRRKRAWSSWNYRLQDSDNDQHMSKLTYNMNILQGLNTESTFCVSLNQSDRIDPKKVIQSFEYSHPVFTVEGIKAQQRWEEIAGSQRTWYCGAYWRNGFHEDGVFSALRVVKSINDFVDKLENNRATV